ncbi:MAG: hypothetical protein ACKO96_46055, partial [Flammeovirgaceae bacterium]
PNDGIGSSGYLPPALAVVRKPIVLNVGGELKYRRMELYSILIRSYPWLGPIPNDGIGSSGYLPPALAVVRKPIVLNVGGELKYRRMELYSILIRSYP